MLNSNMLMISILAVSADALEVVAEEIAHYGTIQPRKKRRTPRGLRIIVSPQKADGLFATLGYLTRQGLVIKVRDITEEVTNDDADS